MKDIRSLLLVLLSIGLVATWVYHIYDKSTYSQRQAGVVTSDSAAKVAEIRDSLQQVYSATISDLDSRLDSSRHSNDSLREQLTYRINEINILRSEIIAILKNPASTSSELTEAKKKMKELEEKVQELRDQNSSIEAEKKSLTAQLQQVTTEVTTLEKNMRTVDEENKQLKERIKTASVFLASALHFTAIDKKEEIEVPTAQAKKADKLVGSFVLHNNLNQVMNAEVFVIITEPDGHTLQNSNWESGSFETRQGTKKSFTRKVKFDYDKGEQKRLLFSLDVDSFQAGRYKLQVWHDGMLIGEAAETLK